MPIGAEIATEKARSAILFSRETRLQGEVLRFFCVAFPLAHPIACFLVFAMGVDGAGLVPPALTARFC